MHVLCVNLFLFLRPFCNSLSSNYIWSVVIMREHADSFPFSAIPFVNCIVMMMLSACSSFVAIALAMALFVVCLFPLSPLSIDIRQKLPRALAVHGSFPCLYRCKGVCISGFIQTLRNQAAEKRKAEGSLCLTI